MAQPTAPHFPSSAPPVDFRDVGTHDRKQKSMSSQIHKETDQLHNRTHFSSYSLTTKNPFRLVSRAYGAEVASQPCILSCALDISYVSKCIITQNASLRSFDEWSMDDPFPRVGSKEFYQ